MTWQQADRIWDLEKAIIDLILGRISKDEALSVVRNRLRHPSAGKDFPVDGDNIGRWVVPGETSESESS